MKSSTSYGKTAAKTARKETPKKKKKVDHKSPKIGTMK